MAKNIDLAELLAKNRDQLTIAVPLVVLALLVLLFLGLIFVPLRQKKVDLDTKILQKKSFLKEAEVTAKDLVNIKKEIEILQEQTTEYERQLPSEIRANLLFETLKEVTEESQIKFVSIEPQKTKKIDLPGSESIYLELPIKIKLKIGYDELIKFLDQIENSNRLLKVADINITSNPQETWRHNVEISISTYASIQKIDEK
ncbi:type 4a pilus biogenesis protein PilO [Candidatus Omnitrophota bacterium]